VDENLPQQCGAIGCYGAVAGGLVLLRLTGIVSISWWWASSPFWLPLLVVACLSVMRLALGGPRRYPRPNPPGQVRFGSTDEGGTVEESK
jgi:membrane protein implicated in regulation of membrane protease activity